MFRSNSIQLQELAKQLIDLWNLMDTSEEERSLFDHVTCNVSASVDEVTIPGALALDLIEQVFKLPILLILIDYKYAELSKSLFMLARLRWKLKG